jgi:hypothetical protein
MEGDAPAAQLAHQGTATTPSGRTSTPARAAITVRPEVGAALIQFASIVVRRSTYEELGGFRPSLPHCMDWDMWKRIAVAKPVHYDPAPMAWFRMHQAADSSRLIATGENVPEERRSIEYSCAQLSPEQAALVRCLK